MPGLAVYPILLIERCVRHSGGGPGRAVEGASNAPWARGQSCNGTAAFGVTRSYPRVPGVMSPAGFNAGARSCSSVLPSVTARAGGAHGTRAAAPAPLGSRAVPAVQASAKRVGRYVRVAFRLAPPRARRAHRATALLVSVDPKGKRTQPRTFHAPCRRPARRDPAEHAARARTVHRAGDRAGCRRHPRSGNATQAPTGRRKSNNKATPSRPAMTAKARVAGRGCPVRSVGTAAPRYITVGSSASVQETSRRASQAGSGDV